MRECNTVLAIALVLVASCTAGGQNRQQEWPETIIVSGQVKEVFSYEEDLDGLVTLRFLFKFDVLGDTKAGGTIKHGDTIYVRSYQRMQAPADWHSTKSPGCPQMGAEVKLFLFPKNEGVYNLLKIEWPGGAPERYYLPAGTSAKAGFTTRQMALGVGCGFLAGAVIVWFSRRARPRVVS